MKFDIAKIIEEVLSNERIRAEVAKNNLTKEQIREALPILIDMNSQDPTKSKFITSFYVASNGSVKRQEILSELGKKEAYLKNIVTQDIYKVNFELDKDYFKIPERERIVKAFMPYLLENPPKKGLYIYGPMGVGKTFTSKRFAKKLAEQGKKVGFVNLSLLATTIKSSFGDTEKFRHISETIKSVEYLFIDDIGAEQVTNWFRDEQLFGILNYRMEKELTTFFTSNYSYKQLEEKQSRTSNQKYRDFDSSKRLLQRVEALSTPVFLTGENKRF